MHFNFTFERGAVRFPLGLLAATPGVVEHIPAEAVADAISRHVRGDWGNVDAEDWKTNDEAVVHGARLLSAYEHNGRSYWIITEADRSATTVLLPEEY